MNFSDFPTDPFALRGMLFTLDIDERVAESVRYLQETYHRKDRLYVCQEFMDYVYADCFRGSFKEWDKHGGFPAVETGHQFDYAIKQALVGSYQAAFGHLRSCFELTLLSVYFSFEKHFLDGENWLAMSGLDWKAAQRQERKWLDSLTDTPFFSSMLKVLKKKERFADFDAACAWLEKLKSNYYLLSDHTHIKGYKMGTQAMNAVRSHFNSSSFHPINTDSLSLFLDAVIQTIENLAVMIALYNPVVLVELDLEEKFGINEPIGFIHPGQSRQLLSLIPPAYQSYFEQLAKTDQEIMDISHWVDSLPALSESELRKQFEDM